MSSDSSGQRPQSRRSGQMIIFMTLSLTVLFSLLGLSADLGYSYYVQVQAQAAADAAARGAAVYAKFNGDTCSDVACNSSYSCPTNLVSASTALQAGCLYAQSNGFTNTGNQTVTMIANNTTLSSGAQPALWVQATVSQTVSHLFLFLAGFSSGTVAATATAGLNVTANNNCIYVLDTGSTSGALTVSGSSLLTASGCGVYVNSTSSTAIVTQGSGSIKASQISIRTAPGFTLGGGSSITPNPPTTVSASAADPFSGVPAPTVSSTCGLSAGSYNGTMNPSTGGTTNVGVYCGGISITGNSVVTMNSGIYIVNGGGFTVGNSAKVTGTNVTIYLTGQHGQTSGPMALTGSSKVSLTARSSGPYEGILFFQDPHASYVGLNSIGNSASLTATGTLYFPTTKFSLSGAVGTSQIGFVVWDLTVANSATVTQDSTGLLTGLAPRTAALLQ